MKLKGNVLKRFTDSQNNNELYTPKGEFLTEENGKKITGKHIFEAEEKRYKELEAKGYVSQGEIADNRDFKMEEE